MRPIARLFAVASAINVAFVMFATPAMADNCSGPSDCFGVAGSFNEAVLGMLGLVALSLILDFLPVIGTVKGVIEGITGSDLITGQELSWWERVLGVVPVIGAVAAAAAVAKAARAASEAAKVAAAAAEAARAAAAAADVAKAAKAASEAAKAAEAARELAKAASAASEAAKAEAAATDAAKAAEKAAEVAKAEEAARDAAKAEEAAREAEKAKEAAEAAAKEAQRIEDLAKDPAQGNKVTPKTTQEAKVGLDLEKQGKLDGPITRSPDPRAEFVDAKGQKWDVKTFNSNFPPKQGGFTPQSAINSMGKDIALGENIIVDTSNMSAQAIADLKAAVNAQGWTNKVIWWP